MKVMILMKFKNFHKLNHKLKIKEPQFQLKSMDNLTEKNLPLQLEFSQKIKKFLKILM